MIAGLLGLLAMRNLFSSSPLVISVQVVAFLLFLWARITFGRRSYHVVADPTEGGLVMGGPYRYIRHPIYAAMCLFTLAGVAGHWSWSSGLYWWIGFGQRRDTNPLRGDISGGPLSRVCSIRSHDLAHDPLCLLRLQFRIRRLRNAIGPKSNFQYQPTPFLGNCDPTRTSTSHTNGIQVPSPMAVSVI